MFISENYSSEFTIMSYWALLCPKIPAEKAIPKKSLDRSQALSVKWAIQEKIHTRVGGC